MDLVGDMLFEQLKRRHGNAIQANRIRPPFRRRATAPGVLRSSRAAWNGDRLWNRMVEYPLWLRKRRERYDIFHIVDHSYAHLALTLRGGRTVVTCHDLDAFRCLTDPAREPRPLWFRAIARRILNGLRSAEHVIFVSEAVRREAGSLGLIPNSRSTVIHNGVHCEPGTDGDADREARRLLGADASGPVLLSVGSTIPRKRIDILLRVFAGVLKEIPASRLIRVGGPLTGPQADLARKLGVARSLVELPFLDRAVLGAVYRSATLLLQPSESEGFGLPVVEAMAHGCPVVASDLPALREIGGKAAVYCQVGNVSEWTESVSRLLNQLRAEPALWNRFRSRSIENARRFTWRETADRVANVYHEVMEKTEEPKTALSHHGQ
jgi:glycosyltransferase involved in cell wall biosynthesis